jgi:hypothetical protein
MSTAASSRTSRVRVRKVLRDVLPVVGLALADHHPEPAAEDAQALLAVALAVISRAMPPELQAQDSRVAAAKDLLHLMRRMKRGDVAEAACGELEGPRNDG